MNTTATKLNFEQYNEELGRGAPSEIRLHAMLRQLEKDKKAYPHEYEICSVMGVALVMLGKFEQALKVLKASFRMGKQLKDAMNIIFAYNCLKQYGEAMGFVLENRAIFTSEVKLLLVILSGRYHQPMINDLTLNQSCFDVIDTANSLSINKDLTMIVRYLIECSPIHSHTHFNISNHIDNGEEYISIHVIMALNNPIKESIEMTAMLVDNFEPSVLDHIFVGFYPSKGIAA